MSIRHSQEDAQRAVGLISLEFNEYTRTRNINLGFINIHTEFKIKVVGEVSYKEIFNMKAEGPGLSPGRFFLTFRSQREEKHAKKWKRKSLWGRRGRTCCQSRQQESVSGRGITIWITAKRIKTNKGASIRMTFGNLNKNSFIGMVTTETRMHGMGSEEIKRTSNFLWEACYAEKQEEQ